MGIHINLDPRMVLESSGERLMIMTFKIKLVHRTEVENNTGRESESK